MLMFLKHAGRLTEPDQIAPIWLSVHVSETCWQNGKQCRFWSDCSHFDYLLMCLNHVDKNITRTLTQILSSFDFIITYRYFLNFSTCWPWWLTWMHVWLVIKRSWVQSPLGSATFFRGDWAWNIFYSDSLPSAYSRRAVVSFWQKNVHKYWLTT